MKMSAKGGIRKARTPALRSASISARAGKALILWAKRPERHMTSAEGRPRNRAAMILASGQNQME
jgi:hypothetical protein